MPPCNPKSDGDWQMVKVYRSEISQSTPSAPIVDVRAMVRAEVLRRMRLGMSAPFERVITKVMTQIERELSALDDALDRSM